MGCNAPKFKKDVKREREREDKRNGKYPSQSTPLASQLSHMPLLA